MLLFNSHLKLIIGKLRSKWDEPFVITNVFPYGVVELKDESTNNTFQVNRHQIKNFHEVPTPTIGEVESIWHSTFVLRSKDARSWVILKEVAQLEMIQSLKRGMMKILSL
ncbi:hypothetical protein CR513_08160, partial [Mucuna pruriens]